MVLVKMSKLKVTERLKLNQLMIKPQNQEGSHRAQENTKRRIIRVKEVEVRREIGKEVRIEEAEVEKIRGHTSIVTNTINQKRGNIKIEINKFIVGDILLLVSLHLDHHLQKMQRRRKSQLLRKQSKILDLIIAIDLCTLISKRGKQTKKSKLSFSGMDSSGLLDSNQYLMKLKML